MLAPAKNSADNKILRRIKKVLVTLFKNGFAICFSGCYVMLRVKILGIINLPHWLFLKYSFLPPLISDILFDLFYQGFHQYAVG